MGRVVNCTYLAIGLQTSRIFARINCVYPGCQTHQLRNDYHVHKLPCSPYISIDRFGETIKRPVDIIGYAWVSTTDQDLTAQRDRLVQEGAVRIFKDIISGKTFDRPGISTLLDYPRSGDTLAVIRLDRLGRSLKELLETVEDIKGREISLISLDERTDTTSATGELVFHVFESVTQFERRLISERTKDGLATARKHGRNPGHPPLVPEIISSLQYLIKAGKAVSQAATHLGIGRSTVNRVTKNAAQ